VREKIIRGLILIVVFGLHEYFCRINEVILNFGISFGIEIDKYFVLLLIILLLVVLWRQMNKDYGIYLVFVGGLINLFDRLRFVGVRDYWNFFGLFYNNINDWLIAIGVFLLFLKLWNLKENK